jgi:N-acetylglutamate synthase
MGEEAAVANRSEVAAGSGDVVREMTIADYEAVRALWLASDGVVLRDADDGREAIARYLARNPGLSFVAERGGAVVGAVLCGSDGRRGFRHHMAVARGARRSGVGRALCDRALGTLAAQGIPKCHLMVLARNEAAQAFWREVGWAERDDLVLMSKPARG